MLCLGEQVRRHVSGIGRAVRQHQDFAGARDGVDPKEIIRKSLDNYGYILLAESMEDAIDAMSLCTLSSASLEYEMMLVFFIKSSTFSGEKNFAVPFVGRIGHPCCPDPGRHRGI